MVYFHEKVLSGNNTNILNATSTSVNKFIRKLCMKDPTVEYIDTLSDFFNQRALAKSMFDKNDHSGVHICLFKVKKNTRKNP